MIKNYSKKMISIMLLIVTLILNMSTLVNATNDITSADIEYITECGQHLEAKDGEDWYTIVTSYVEYTAPNGNKYPAYCLDNTKPGVGTSLIGDLPEGYTVNINKLLDNDVVYRAVINGYPYKTPKELGLADKYEAFTATKQAVYSALYNYNVDERYRALDERGEVIKSAIKKIVNIARTGTQTQSTPKINFEKIGDLSEDAINNNFFSQTYNITSDIAMKEYSILNIKNFPKGTKITDIKNNEKSTFLNGEKFKILIPRANVQDSNIDGTITIETKCKTFPVFYGSKSSELQPYAITYAEYGNDIASTNLKVKMNTGKIKILKNDSVTKQPISNVTFKLQKQNGEIVGNVATDNNGIATYTGLYEGRYILKEISTNSNYVLDTKEFKIDVKYNEISNLTIENEHKKGSLNIHKVDKDNTKIGIENVEFRIYSNELKKIVGTYKTDANGEIQINNLRTGDYKITETKTDKWYKLLESDINVKIEYNKTTKITVENELKKGQFKIIKVDLDNDEVKLKDVEFQVKDKKGNILETLKTNDKGEAISKKYSIRDYGELIIAEIKTGKWYKLNDEPRTINIKEDEIIETTFTNEKKKGQIKIIKEDLDDENTRIANVEFEVYDEKGNVVGSLKTDKNGEAVSTKLPIEQKYTIKEIKTDEWYLLNEKTQEVNLKEDEIKEIVITNEKKKGQIKVIKVDKEDNSIKLEGVEFEVLDEQNNVLERITTDCNGEALTSKYAIKDFPKLKIRESKTLDEYILSSEAKIIELESDKINEVIFENQRIKGQIKIIKTSLDDNYINKTKAGSPIENVKFNIYDIKGNKVDEIKTDKNGVAISKELYKGIYMIKEIKAGKWYLLNDNTFTKVISKPGQLEEIHITNESKKPSIDIEKTGIIQTTANEEIKYDFKIKNTGNVLLNDFVWTDVLPTEYIKITKLITGTYNQDLTYSIHYKTNKNDYRLLKENLSTKVNNYVDFSNIKLEEGEVVTEFKVDFGTVDVGFESVIHPYIFTKVNSNVKNDDTFTNKTKIEGNHEGYIVWDKDDHTTKVYEKEITIKKLPRTGM